MLDFTFEMLTDGNDLNEMISNSLFQPYAIISELTIQKGKPAVDNPHNEKENGTKGKKAKQVKQIYQHKPHPVVDENSREASISGTKNDKGVVMASQEEIPSQSAEKIPEPVVVASLKDELVTDATRNLEDGRNSKLDDSQITDPVSETKVTTILDVKQPLPDQKNKEKELIVMDGLPISTSNDELELISGKSTEDILSYFSELDCPQSDNAPQTLEDGKMLANLWQKR
ncbi:hypothetical protein ACH5RR_021453 [Cinchona calisaya]|uniref:Uncharacterized protein n=1 Tax=Cinchona calisaya TaxID=153742 RepID=A0ABD2ZHD7_9GENT